MHRWAVHVREESYAIENDAGTKEQFERLVVSLRVVRTFLYGQRLMGMLRRRWGWCVSKAARQLLRERFGVNLGTMRATRLRQRKRIKGVVGTGLDMNLDTDCLPAMLWYCICALCVALLSIWWMW